MSIELPAGLRAEHTVVHPGSNGCTIVLGIEPLRIDGPPPGGGQVSITSYIQWATAIHLPPAAMKHLRDQLIAVVDQWEAQLGTITIAAPAPPKPTPAAFNPDVVRKTDQPSADPPAPQQEDQPDGFEKAIQVAEQTRWGFRLFHSQRDVQSGSEARPDHRPRSGECPQPEPEPSPSSPTA